MTTSAQAAVAAIGPAAFSIGWIPPGIAQAARFSVSWNIPAILISVFVAALLWFLPASLATDARLCLMVTALCIVGWTLTRIPDSLVAIGGAVALVATGALKEEQLYQALGSELVWLLLAAFVIAAVLKSSGLMEIAVARATKPFTTITGLFHALAFLIAATAFFIPSTSGRAALLLPVYIALASQMPDPRLVRPLALLFPSVILLSAGGSLIGAGAHLIAVDTISRSGGGTIGYLGWIVLAFPFAMLTSLAATWLIIALFVPADLRAARIKTNAVDSQGLDAIQKRLALALLVLVGLWISQPLHGLDIALIALAGALILLFKPFNSKKPKDIFRGIEMELILFLTAAVVIADALTVSGADRWLAERAMAILPESMTGSLPFVVVFMAIVAVTAHLVINSRSARAAVLIPAVALPVADFGHDVRLIVLMAVLGTGFCQTMMASAKPVALYGNQDSAPFNQADLFRLAVPLMPVVTVLLVMFALFIWPHQLGHAPARPMAMTAAAAAETVPAIKPPASAAPAKEAEPPMQGALCTRRELSIAMHVTIAKRKMWASGWWHVWNALRKSGMPVEKQAVRAIYREENMVALRAHSIRLAQAVADTTAGDAAIAACKGKP
jgi:di/tricarboxylate transporter